MAHLPQSYKPIEVLSADHLEAVHNTSLRILEEHGMEFLDDEALALLKGAGADVKTGDRIVRFDRGFVLESIAKAPSEVRLHARNPSAASPSAATISISAQSPALPTSATSTAAAAPATTRTIATSCA